MKVIIDRRKTERRERGTVDSTGKRERRDRRRSRVPGEFPPIDTNDGLKLVVHVDGGARGNPGPAAAAAVLSTPDGDVVDEAHETARRGDEQRRRVPRRCCSACSAPARSAPREVEVVNDSELVAKQVNGQYKVKHPDMKPLHAAGQGGARGRSGRGPSAASRGPRTRAADALVNAALDAARADRSPDAACARRFSCAMEIGAACR